MLRSNTNIIGYLQKKAFFTKSPSPSPSPNSRFATSPSTIKNNITPPKNKLNSATSSSKGTINTFNRTIFPVNRQGKIKADPYNYLMQQNNSFQKIGNKPKVYNKKPFQSSRVQVKTYMQQLLGRITVQLRMLQGAITELTVSLQSLFYRKLHQLKQQLLQNVDTIFAKAKNNLSNMLNKNSEDHLKKLLKADQRLQKLKNGMENNWRRVAGELLMEEYDQKIQKILQDSEGIRKDAEINRREIGQAKQQSAWQTVEKCVSALIQRRCS